MRQLLITAALSYSTTLFGSVVLASDDPPPAKSPPAGDKPSEPKKEADNGLSDLITGLVGQSLNVFLDPELLKQVPGDNAAEKAENVKRLLGMIEGETLRD